MTPWPAGLLTAATPALFRRQGRKSPADPVVAHFLVKPAELSQDAVQPQKVEASHGESGLRHVTSGGAL